MVFRLWLILFIYLMVGGLKYKSSTCAVAETLCSSYEDPILSSGVILE